MRSLWVAVATASIGCSSGPGPAECSSSTQCQAGPEGACIPSSEGTSWCSYPDDTCPGGSTGRRWSVEAPPNLTAQCVPGHTLEVDFGDGAGLGSATLSVSGSQEVTCQANCSIVYGASTVVEIRATGSATARFEGFSPAEGSACDADSCLITMDTDRRIGLAFTTLPLLTLKVLGSGEGTVTSTTGDFSCTSGSVCTIPLNMAVTLSATAASGSVFLGWDGACAGSGVCAVSPGTQEMVVAYFVTPGESVWGTQVVAAPQGSAIVTSFDLAADLDSIFVSGAVRGTLVDEATIISLESGGVTDIPFVRRAGGKFVSKLALGTGAPEWVVAIEDMDYEYSSVVGDSAGDTIVAGNFEAPNEYTFFDFGFRVRKLSGVDGHAIWARAFPALEGPCIVNPSPCPYGNQLLRALAVDGSGNPVVFFNFAGTVSVGSDTWTSSGGVIVAKLSAATGIPLWSRMAPGGQASAVAIDETGDIVLLGYKSAGAPPPFGGLADGTTMYVARLDGVNGSPLFSIGFGGQNGSGAATVTPKALATTADGDIVVAGTYREAFSARCAEPLPPPEAVPPSQPQDIFLFALTAAGSCRWTLAVRSLSWKEAFAVNVSRKDGAILLTGSFVERLQLGSETLNAAGSADLFLARINDSDGSVMRAARFGGVAGEGGGQGVLGEDGDGHVLIGGDFRGFAEFGGLALRGDATSDGFVVMLAPLM